MQEDGRARAAGGPDEPPRPGPEVGDDAEVEPAELQALVDRVPSGWTEVGYAGRRWGLTRVDHARGGTTTLYAEELGGTSAVSANVWHTSDGDVLRPCEMPARVVLDFLRGWAGPGRPDEPTQPDAGG